MRLNDIVNHTQSFFETVGYLRLSNFYSAADLSQGECIQKIARITAGIFVILSIIDFFIYPLDFTAKAIVNGSLIILISSLGINLLLKKVQKFLNLFLENPKIENRNELEDGNNLDEQDESDEDIVETPERMKFSKIKNRNDDKDASYFFTPACFLEETSPEMKERLSRVRRNLLPDFEKLDREA